MITLFHLIYYSVNILYNVFKQRIFGDVEKFQNAQYLTVLKILFHEKWDGKIKKVLNFVYGDFSFVSYLRSFHDHCEVLAVDIGSEMSEINKISLRFMNEYSVLQAEPLDISIIRGNISDLEERLNGTDAVVCMNILEYIYPRERDILPYNIFGFIRPRLAVFTVITDDFDSTIYNTIEINNYKYKWTSDQFTQWALNVVDRYTNYSVKIENKQNLTKSGDKKHSTYCLAIFTINSNEDICKNDCDNICLDWSSINSTSNNLKEVQEIPCLIDKHKNVLNMSETICTPDSLSDEMNVICLIPGKDKSWHEKVLQEAENHISMSSDVFTHFNEEKCRIEVPLSKIMLFLKDLCTIEELTLILQSSDWILEECSINNIKELCVIYNPKINSSSIDSNESIFNTDTDKLEDNDFSDWDGECNSFQYDLDSPIDSEREFFTNNKSENKPNLESSVDLENVKSIKKICSNLTSKNNVDHLDDSTQQIIPKKELHKFNSFDSELFSIINKTSLKESQTFDGSIYDILKDLSKNEIKPVKHSVTCNMINKIIPEHSKSNKEKDISKTKSKEENAMNDEQNQKSEPVNKFGKQLDDKETSEPQKSSCSDVVSISEASLERCNSIEEQNDLLFDSGYQKSNLELSPQSPVEFYVEDDFDDKSEMEQADLHDRASAKIEYVSEAKLKSEAKNDSDESIKAEIIEKEVLTPEAEINPLVEQEIELDQDVPGQIVVENQEVVFRAPIVENGDLINNNRDYEGNNYEERVLEPDIFFENDNDLIPQQQIDDINLDADNENHIVIEEENQGEVLILHGDPEFGEDLDVNYIRIVEQSNLSISTNDSGSSIPDSMTDIESEEDIEAMPEDPFPEWLLLLLNNPNDFNVDFLSRGDSLSVNPDEESTSSSSDEPVSVEDNSNDADNSDDEDLDDATAVDEGIEISEVYYDSVEEIPVNRILDNDNEDQ